MSDSDRIEGVVAKVINGFELVINRGTNSGVEIGMRFAILADEGFGITDPETGEKLGDIERPKTLVKVTRVEEKFCVAATYRTKHVGGLLGAAGSTIASFGRFAEPARSVRETFQGDNYVPPLDEKQSIVHSGDKAVQAVGDEFGGWAW